jgi:hypothetical protein
MIEKKPILNFQKVILHFSKTPYFYCMIYPKEKLEFSDNRNSDILSTFREWNGRLCMFGNFESLSLSLYLSLTHSH